MAKVSMFNKNIKITFTMFVYLTVPSKRIFLYGSRIPKKITADNIIKNKIISILSTPLVNILSDFYIRNEFSMDIANLSSILPTLVIL